MTKLIDTIGMKTIVLALESVEKALNLHIEDTKARPHAIQQFVVKAQENIRLARGQLSMAIESSAVENARRKHLDKKGGS